MTQQHLLKFKEIKYPPCICETVQSIFRLSNCLLAWKDRLFYRQQNWNIPWRLDKKKLLGETLLTFIYRFWSQYWILDIKLMVLCKFISLMKSIRSTDIIAYEFIINAIFFWKQKLFAEFQFKFSLGMIDWWRGVAEVNFFAFLILHFKHQKAEFTKLAV